MVTAYKKVKNDYLNKMNKIVLLLLLSFAATITMAKSKPSPKRYVGVYEGTQEKYTLLSTEQEELEVEKAQLLIVLERNQITLKVGKYKLEGSFEVQAKTKEYYALEVTLSNGVVEYWNLYRKEKKILRKPVYPIPEIFLFKK